VEVFCGLRGLTRNVLACTAKRLPNVTLAEATVYSLPRERQSATSLVILNTCLCLVTWRHVTIYTVCRTTAEVLRSESDRSSHENFKTLPVRRNSICNCMQFLYTHTHTHTHFCTSLLAIVFTQQYIYIYIYIYIHI
jgi:hypothetical protein